MTMKAAMFLGLTMLAASAVTAMAQGIPQSQLPGASQPQQTTQQSADNSASAR
jgi:hypothetical protein